MTPPHTMQTLNTQSRVRSGAFQATPTRTSVRCAVRCQVQKQQQPQAAAAAAAVVAASLLVPAAAHAATDLLQPGMDVATAVGSGAAVAGLGALLVATDPQKRCVLPRLVVVCVGGNASIMWALQHRAATLLAAPSGKTC